MRYSHSQYRDFEDFCEKNRFTRVEAIDFLKKEIERLQQLKE